MKIQKNLLQSRGFTIVELLIVIVVIGILAAITIVAYNGVQQRANNTAIINAASETVKAIQSYYAIKSDAPSPADRCVTIETGCVNGAGTTYTTALDFGDTGVNAPRSVARSGDVAYGIRYNFTPSRTFNGASTPVMIAYYLQGTNQDCKLANVMSEWGAAVTSTIGHSGNLPGKTQCYIAIPLG